MKKITANILYFLLLLFTITANAQKQTPPAGGTPKDFKLPAAKKNTLANGMRATLVQYGTIPKVNISLIIKTGSVHEAANQVWLSSLLASLMNEGTTSINAKNLARKVAGMGGEINVSSGADQFTIEGSVLSEYAVDLVKLIADVAINPALPASELERLKNDLKRQLAISKTDPQSIAEEKFFNVIYGDHPYGRTFPTEKILSGYTLNDVRNFYNANLGAKRSVLYVAGKFDEAAVNKTINQSFAKWKKGEEVKYPPAPVISTVSTTIINRKDAPQTTLLIGLPAINPADADFLSMSVANSLLGGSFGSRITSNIRENKGYTYSPFSTIRTHPGSSIWYENAAITSEHTIDAVEEIKKEITRMQNEAPSKEELEGIQRYEAGIFVLRNSSPRGIINQLNFLDLYGLDDSYLTDRVKNIYAVTPQKISELTKKYIIPGNMFIVMVGDEASIKQQQAKK